MNKPKGVPPKLPTSAMLPPGLAGLAGAALKPLPLAPLQPPLDLAFSVMQRRHLAIFERLAKLGDSLFVIDPIDLPLVFMLQPGGESPSLKIDRNADGMNATATIRGSLPLLIDLLEGRLDGDALFFNRELTVVGDTEAVLLLRNAVDSDEVDVLGDLLSIFGPLAGPARSATESIVKVGAQIAADLEDFRKSLKPRAPRNVTNSGGKKI